MKKLLLSVCCVFIYSISVFAQRQIEGHWGKQYLNVAYAAAATNDGGYIITGLTKNGIADSNGDIIVIKTSATGDTLWTLIYGGPNLEGGNSVIQTADGGYMVSGHTEDFGAIDCDAFLMKLDKNGNYEWLKTYGGAQDDISESVLEMPDGAYVMAGITASYGNSDPASEVRHVYFIKTNSAGDTIWTKYYAGPGAEYSYSIASMPQGGFLAVGWSTSWGNGEHDGWLLRLKDNGDTLWTRLYKNTGDTRFYKILPTLDNGYIIAGFTTQTASSQPQGLAIKLDAEGNQVWQKTYGGTADNIIFQGVAQLPNGNFIFTGTSHAVDVTGNVYVLTTDDNGNKIADYVCGGNSSSATGIAAQGNNSYLVAGTTAKYGNPYGDMYWMEMNNTFAGVPTVSETAPRIYPNPVTDNSVVVLPASEAYQLCSVNVMGVDGKLIYHQAGIMAGNIVIQRGTLAAGIYLFRIFCVDGKVYNGRFAVE